MKGLIRKEWYASKLNFLCFGVMALCFFVLYLILPKQNLFFIFYPALLISTVSTSSITLDESDRWDVFSAALPCSRAQLVSVKYLVSLVPALTLSLLTLAVSLMKNDPSAFTIPCLTLTYLLLTAGANLFPAFKWGSRKSRIPSIILTLALFFLLTFGAVGSSSHVNLIFFLLPAAVLVFFLLWFLSIRAYQKRDL